MLKVAQDELLARLDSARWTALAALVHRFRHEIATPLSAAALHAEIARRRSGAEESAAPGTVPVAESLGIARKEIETAGDILEAFVPMIDEAAEPGAPFFLAEVARESLAPVAAYCRGSGRVLDLVAEERGPGVFGRRRQVAAAIETAGSVIATAGEPGAVFRWSVETIADAVRLRLDAEGRFAAFGPDELVGLRSGGRLRSCRWAFESHGGEFRLSCSRDRIELAAGLPRVET